MHELTRKLVLDSGRSQVLQGCADQICDVVVKNVAPGPIQMLISIALCVNLALNYIMMLAPSRQYVESAVLLHLADCFPSIFVPSHESISDQDVDVDVGEYMLQCVVWRIGV